jgi:hypothetical protein
VEMMYFMAVTKVVFLLRHGDFVGLIFNLSNLPTRDQLVQDLGTFQRPDTTVCCRKYECECTSVGLRSRTNFTSTGNAYGIILAPPYCWCTVNQAYFALHKTLHKVQIF